MPTVAWIYSSADPAASGELRRLVLPALGIEGGAWTSRVVSAAHPALLDADVAVAPMAAIHVLPALSGPRPPKVIIEVDDAAVLDPSAIEVLAPLAGRIDAVVARGARALREAVRVLPDRFPVLLIPDVSETLPELQASAIRFGLRPPGGGAGPAPPDGCELWFTAPGDVVDAAEVDELARRWRRETSTPRAAVAEPQALEMIAQSGLTPDFVASGASALHQAMAGAGCCIVPVGAESSRARRRRAAQRHGVALVDSLAGAGGESCDARECAAAWRSAISALLDSRGAGRGRAPTVLVLLDLVQDLDLALPIIDQLAARPDLQLKLVVTAWLDDRSPRVAAELASRRVAMQLATRQQVLSGAAPSLDGVDAVFCVVETNDPAHARCHTLVRRAKAAGIPTFSLQHGLENVGLTLFPGGGDRTIVSDHVFVWFGREQTPDVTPAALRPRLIHVGRPGQEVKSAGLRSIFEGYSRLAAVFENLHWDRYSQAYRRRFLEDVCEFAQAYPETAVLVKPHHAGMWTAKNRSAFPQWGANLVLADPSDPLWEPFTAPSLVAAADLVITTPSTVALDAALARRPVAVVAYGMDLPVFAPLPLLQGPADWVSFGRSTDPAAGAGARAAFVSRVNLPGSAERAAADCVAAAAAAHAGRAPARTAAE